SNRSIWVKHFQALHRCVVDVARGLALLFGLGTKALPSWDSKTRWNNLLVDLAVNVTAGSRGHTNSPHPSSREGHHSTHLVELDFLLLHLVLPSSQATATSLFHRNAVPPTHTRCIITAKLRSSATTAFFIPQCLAIFIDKALSQDHFAERTNMLWAASYSIIRIISSPHRDIAPVRSFSPDCYLPGVNPTTPPTPLEFRNRPGASTGTRRGTAPTGPTPGFATS